VIAERSISHALVKAMTVFLMSHIALMLVIMTLG
jgi:hypothetical protein